MWFHIWSWLGDLILAFLYKQMMKTFRFVADRIVSSNSVSAEFEVHHAGATGCRRILLATDNTVKQD